MLGIAQVVSTLSEISKESIKQKFLTINLPDYVPILVDEQGSYSDEMFHIATYYAGTDFISGVSDYHSVDSRLPRAEVGYEGFSVPIRTWMAEITWSTDELKKALKLNNFDIISAKVEALKRIWDLGIQETAFFGIKSVKGMTGLLNNPEVKVSETKIHDIVIDESCFLDLTERLLSEYDRNTDGTQLPDTLIIPSNKYWGLGSFSKVSSDMMKIEYLKKAFSVMTGNDNFKILSLNYANKDNAVAKRNKLSCDRYVLYNSNVETLRMDIPVDFTLEEPDVKGNFFYTQIARGRFTGATIMRPKEVLYIDTDYS